MARVTGGAGRHQLLPGPSGFSQEQLGAVYDAVDDDRGTVPVLGEVFEPEPLPGEPGDPCPEDLAWWAWCAARVAAGGGEAHPGLRGAAAAHWTWQAEVAARQGRAEAAARGQREVQRREHLDAVVAFTAWLADAGEEVRARVALACAERAQVRRAGGHLAAVRRARAVAGAGLAAQWRQLAPMAVLYRAAVAPVGAPAGTYGIPAIPAVPAAGAEPGLVEGPGGLFTDAVADAGVPGGVEALVAQVAPVLGLSIPTARRRVVLAPRVVWLLPRTLGRLAGGDIDQAQLLVVAEESAFAPVAVARRLDEEVFGPGGTGLGDDGWALAPGALRAEVVRVLGVLDAEAVRVRSRRKTSARGVAFRALGDGMARWEVTGPSPALRAAHAQLSAVAGVNRAEARRAVAGGGVAADGGDPYAVAGVDTADPARVGDLDAPLADRRTLDAHRFDALMTAVGRARPADGSRVPAVRLELHVGLATALDAGVAAGGEDPGWLEGVGSVPAWLCRQSLTWRGAVLRRLLVDPYTGDLVTVDGHTYPASWLTTPPRDGRGGTGDGPGGPGGPGGGPPGGRAGPSGGAGGCSSEGPAGGRSFQGRPVQDLPPPRTEDDVLAPPLGQEQLERMARGELVGDPCADGTCDPLDPGECPLRAVGGGPHDPPAALERLVRRAWGSCTGPGSTVRAGAADLDHVVAHRAGGLLGGGAGPTCSCNLEPKSRFWHRVKHATDPATDRNPADPLSAEVPWPRRWAQWRCSEGSSHWISPLGTRHHTRPRPVGQGQGPFRRLHSPAYRSPALPALSYRDDVVADLPERPTF